MNWNSSKNYDINGIGPFICHSVKTIIFKCIFLRQICLHFTSVYYFEIFNIFKFPIQLFVTFDKVRNARNIYAIPYASAKKL